MTKFFYTTLFAMMLSGYAFAQTNITAEDSLHLERRDLPAKILHAEPLYIDLIRDLGARKGEKEWNVGFGLTDHRDYDAYEALVEYEWAPIDRLGLEVEVPFTFYSSNGNAETTPSNRIESLKLATQWTFLVSEKHLTSMAFGYIHEFAFVDLNRMNGRDILQGQVFNPFLIAAKNWDNNFHTLLYTGPVFHKAWGGNEWHSQYEINSNFHYMIPNTRNFIGVEVNKVLERDNFDMVIRPQMRVEISEQLMIGIVTGIPVSKEHERFSSFLRLIYEPSH
ncbi:HAEPLYID family protein [Sediminitomix flava]|uniref:Phosphoribosylformylglycinamidine synthase n=1 Tax=Sediminitomix flava TaxID=379075 RepID=A0A315ZB60_SEDFL|nr:HAEPLYID family protein [Sediminitomix flava]PWJ42781.1 hypothetical protein BC781_102327 [Sediminitomix flava]